MKGKTGMKNTKKVWFGFIATIVALSSAAMAAKIGEDTLVLGKPGSSSNKTIQLGSSVQGKIKYDVSSGKLQFANDGSTYKNFGSGSGGSGGVNLLVDNPDFEAGISTAWTQSSPGTVTARTGTNALFDTTSARFQATGSSQTYKTNGYLVSSGLFGSPCMGMIRYNTTESSNKYSLEVVNDDSEVIGTNTLEATTNPQWGYVTFKCPESSATTNQKTLSLQVKSSGSAAYIDLDNAHLGSDIRLADISGAQFVGAITITGCAANWTTTSTSFAAFSAASSCSYSTAGSAQAPSTNVPGIKFSSLLPGEYMIQFEGVIANATSGKNAYVQFTDGTNTARETTSAYANSVAPIATSAFQSISYSSAQSNVTLQLYGKTDSAGTTNVAGTTALPAVIKVYRFPTVAETGVRVDQLGWRVDANISGANPSLGISNVSSYTGIENGSLTLSNNTGNGVVSAQIPCSSTNAPTGTTCAAGNESVGVSFNLPNAGDVLACVSFGNLVTNGAAGDVSATFQVVETASNSQTILQEGKSRAFYRNNQASQYGATPQRVCGTFSFASSGQKTLRLMYEQLVSGTVSSHAIIADAGATYGQSDIHWEVYPLNYLSGALPIFKGMVTSESSGIEQAKRLHMTASCTTGTCTLAKNNGFSSCTWSSTGVYNCAFSNAYSDVPTCILNANAESGNVAVCRSDYSNTSSSNLRVNCFTSGSTTAVNAGFSAQCFGPK